MKDALGHGSNPRNDDAAKALDYSGQGAAPTHPAMDNFRTATYAADENGFAKQPSVNGLGVLREASDSGRREYNEGAVNKAIAASNRAGRKISGREAKAIHALLKGRH
jgi:hypothetical protein